MSGAGGGYGLGPFSTMNWGSIAVEHNWESPVAPQLPRLSGFGLGPYSAMPWGCGGEEPVISDWSIEPVGDIRRLDVISFNVINNAWSFLVDVSLVFSTGEIEPVWRENRFTERYWRGSARVPIDRGARYMLRRSGGWPGSRISVTVSTTDLATNVSTVHSS